MRPIEKAKELGARAILLNVSAPFHCPLMQPAADEMAEALAGATIVAPRAPLVANVTPGRPTTRGDPPDAGGAGDRPRALAREHALDGREAG
jgi:acyl transferase domain-containing protein